MISCIFDLFYPHPPKPTLDLLLTYFNIFGVSGPLGGLSLLKAKYCFWGPGFPARLGSGTPRPVFTTMCV